MDFSFPRLQNLLPATIVVMFLCWSGLCLTFWHRYQKLKTLSSEVSVLIKQRDALEKQAHLHKRRQEQNTKAQPGYVKANIESISLLQEERLRVTALAKQFPDNTSLKERLSFLESDQNRICFNNHLIFKHRVQMDLSDLRKFLEAVEQDRYDATQGRPFLLMKKFDLVKCYEKGDERVYSIHAELMQ